MLLVEDLTTRKENILRIFFWNFRTTENPQRTVTLCKEVFLFISESFRPISITSLFRIENIKVNNITEHQNFHLPPPSQHRQKCDDNIALKGSISHFSREDNFKGNTSESPSWEKR